MFFKRKKILNSENTLFVGAHPDDVFISSGITIMRNPGNSYVITLTDGAPSDKEMYPYSPVPGTTYKNRNEYSTARIREDRLVMESIGIDNARYFNAMLEDQEIVNSMEDAYSLLEWLIEVKKIKRIVTHSFPESHPDHEACCIVSHIAGLNFGVDVWEYPMYKYDDDEKLVFGIPGSLKYKDKIKNMLTMKETSAKKELYFKYASQQGIYEKYSAKYEAFFKVSRMFPLREKELIRYIHAVRETDSLTVRKKMNKSAESLLKNI